MKILWIVNIMLPAIAKANGKNASPFGGWLDCMSNSLGKMEGVQLTILYPNACKQKGETQEGYNFESFVGKKDLDYILAESDFDVCHIFGTEYEHSLHAINAVTNLGKVDNTVISIQGLISICAKHYINELPYLACLKQSFRDFLKMENIFSKRNDFAKRGKYEELAIKKSKHIIGSSDWDYACVKRLNKDVHYHFCNDTLRDEFYFDKWDVKKIEKHSIFVSQCGYPLKGFHLMLEAFNDILAVYPDSKLYVTGHSPFVNGMKRIRQDYYSLYLKKLIIKYDLKNKVVFLGTLNVDEMKNRFLKSNVFALTSSIENTSNVLCEAMLLGMPSVASDVGGITNHLEHKKEGFVYQQTAPYMLAYYIMKIFEDDDLAVKMGSDAKKKTEKAHDRSNNLQTLIEIYNEIK